MTNYIRYPDSTMYHLAGLGWPSEGGRTLCSRFGDPVGIATGIPYGATICPLCAAIRRNQEEPAINVDAHFMRTGVWVNTPEPDGETLTLVFVATQGKDDDEHIALYVWHAADGTMYCQDLVSGEWWRHHIVRIGGAR